MDESLSAHHLSKLKPGDLKDSNRPVTSNEIEAVMESFPSKPSPRPHGLSPEFHETFKEDLTITHLVPKYRKQRSITKFIL